MSLNTYVSSAWEEIADLQCPEVNGARETADASYAYIDGAWEEVWNDCPRVSFDKVATTGTTEPEYEYVPSDDGLSAYYKLINKNTEATTSSMALILELPLSANEQHLVSYSLSEVVSTSSSYAVAIYYRTQTQDYLLRLRSTPPSTIEDTITFTPTAEVTHIIFNLELYNGKLDVYHSGRLSKLSIDGITYEFE